MNHDKLSNAVNSTLLNIYSILYDEYKNEQKSKKEVFKLVSQALKQFGAVSDLYETIMALNEQYNTASLADKKIIREKLGVINNAIKIMEDMRGEI